MIALISNEPSKLDGKFM